MQVIHRRNEEIGRSYDTIEGWCNRLIVLNAIPVNKDQLRTDAMSRSIYPNSSVSKKT